MPTRAALACATYWCDDEASHFYSTDGGPVALCHDCAEAFGRGQQYPLAEVTRFDSLTDAEYRDLHTQIEPEERNPSP